MIEIHPQWLDRTGRSMGLRRQQEDTDWETCSHTKRCQHISKKNLPCPNQSVSYQSGSLMYCASPGMCAGDTTAWAPSLTPWSGPHWSSFSHPQIPSASCASSAPGSRWLALRCWRRSPSWEDKRSNQNTNEGIRSAVYSSSLATAHCMPLIHSH